MLQRGKGHGAEVGSVMKRESRTFPVPPTDSVASSVQGMAASEQGAGAPALHLEGGREEPQLLLGVGGVARGVERLQPHVPVQAAAVVGEGVEGELPMVFSHPTAPWNTHRTGPCSGWDSAPDAFSKHQNEGKKTPTGFSEQHRHGGGIPFFQCLLQVYGCSVQQILLQLSNLEALVSPFYPPPFIYTSFAGFCKS